MSEIYLSIVVPVYNAVNYLDDCINSILCQTYRNFEVLLIDDGSTDGSSKICDKMVTIDNRVKCIHLKNSGPSNARNIGFKNAIGKYVYCIDDDDKILSNHYFYDVISLLAENEVDIVITGATYFKASENEIKKVVDYSQFFDINKQSPRKIINTLIKNNLIQISCWTKFIKRDFLIQNSLFFDKNLIVEDLEWNLRMWPLIKTMKVLKSADYCHIYREGSIASGDSPRTIKCREDQIKTIKIGLELFEQNNSDKEFSKVILTYLNYQFFIAIHSINILNGENRKRLLNELLKYDRITKYNYEKRVKILSIFYHLFGIRGALFGMKIYTYFLRPSTKKRFFKRCNK